MAFGADYCRECMKIGARKAGLDPDDTDNWRCVRTACENQIPDLSPIDQQIVYLFQRCKRKWVFGFDGRRVSLDMKQVEIIASSLGIELNDYVLLKLEACEEVVADYDRIRYEQQQ
jgi:hypothetical protein